jgi:methionine-rich copper-binding protein CopC
MEEAMPRVLPFFLLAAVVLALPSGAGAHARLERAEPSPDATVSVAPVEVRIWTTEELTLSGNKIVVTDASGVRVDNDDARVDQSVANRKQMFVSLGALANGTYTVGYTTSSADDGHVWESSYSFTVEASGVVPSSELALDCLD